MNGNHLFYGNGPDQTSAYREAAANKAMAENILRQAYDPNKKAIRVACAEEEF